MLLLTTVQQYSDTISELLPSPSSVNRGLKVKRLLLTIPQMLSTLVCMFCTSQSLTSGPLLHDVPILVSLWWYIWSCEKRIGKMIWRENYSLVVSYNKTHSLAKPRLSILWYLTTINACTFPEITSIYLLLPSKTIFTEDYWNIASGVQGDEIMANYGGTVEIPAFSKRCWSRGYLLGGGSSVSRQPPGIEKAPKSSLSNLLSVDATQNDNSTDLRNTE